MNLLLAGYVIAFYLPCDHCSYAIYYDQSWASLIYKIVLYGNITYPLILFMHFLTLLDGNYGHCTLLSSWLCLRGYLMSLHACALLGKPQHLVISQLGSGLHHEVSLYIAQLTHLTSLYPCISLSFRCPLLLKQDVCSSAGQLSYCRCKDSIKWQWD